jgi:phosphoserine phosphatase RsbU/P
MAARFRSVLGRLGRLDIAFLLLLILALAGNALVPASVFQALLVFAAFVAGVLVAFKWMAAGMRKLIWRLRYRLLVTYLFIAVVPIVLTLILAGVGIYILTGQVAAYMVTTELERRVASLADPAQGIAAGPADLRLERARWIAPYFAGRFPGFQMLVRDGRTWRFPENASIEPPPAGWGDASGVVLKTGAPYLWVHAISKTAEVTMLAPLTAEALANLVPNLGQVALGARKPSPTAGTSSFQFTSSDLRGRVPAAANRLDGQVAYAAFVPVALWDHPNQTENEALFLVTRVSAVLQTVFGQKPELSDGITAASLASLIFSITGILLLVVELGSIVIGVRLTRTITRAVHGMYEGTERVRAGDFSHRIEVRGGDQLATLGVSFNSMTENLERLVEVAKEKERLQSEIEIAREVQNQLFPKSLPVAKTLRLAAMCKPARLVSGDYYDYMNLEGSSVAVAIGDVSGKGISAALLMATVQASMRTQLRAVRELAAAAGNGRSSPALSTSSMVARLNQQLHAYTPPEKFATFYFALYDDDTGRMTYTNAGHLPPILVRRGAVSRLDVNGTVVGAFSFSKYGESVLDLEPGDLLACFTDGITEPENEFGEMFGEDRLADVLVRNAGRDSGEVIAAVMESVREWTGSPELQDDMTLLLARRV